MTYTKVRPYTDAELISHVKSLHDFKGIPSGRWMLFVRSNEDTPNVYDDKCYVFHGEVCLDVMTCTTNPGTPALLGGFRKYNKIGAALVKANQWCYDAFQYGLHQGRMPALRQVKKIWYHRDGDLDNHSEENGLAEFENFNTNIHTNTYKYFDGVVKWFIGEWSYGCLVINDRIKYIRNINWFKAKKATNEQAFVTICIIEEF